MTRSKEADRITADMLKEVLEQNNDSSEKK